MELHADYKTPIVEALAVLEDSGIDQFPVDLHAIQRQYKNLFTIRSYGFFMESAGMSRPDCMKYFRSEDGAAVQLGSRYIIFYNETKPKKRIRFTIAHEMGHIFLDHHYEYGEPILDREGIGQQLYTRLEKEAGCFARNLLCPADHTKKLLEEHGITKCSKKRGDWQKTRERSLTRNLTVWFDAAMLIENAFDVSDKAAEVRMDFLNIDIDNSKDSGIDSKTTSHIKQTASWYCYHCGLERFPGTTYCFECGKNHFAFQVNTVGFQYRDANINDSMQFSPCPVCGNDEFSEDADFCKVCGTPLSNRCTQDATHINHPEAKYCYECGKPTFFKGTIHHTKVKKSVITNTEGDLRMIYECDIKYDQDTNRIKECPRCNNEIFSESAQYCRICGLEMINKCIPQPLEDDRGNLYDQDPHNNSPDARFCEQCGAPTVYFQKHSILKSYEDVLKALSGNKKQEFDEDIPF